MKFKLIVIFVILTFCVYSVAYSHSGRTNSSGCHNVTATGGYHCHGGGSSSSSGSSSSGTRSSGTDLEQYDGALLLGGVIVLVVVCWAVIDPDSCCLFDTSHNSDAVHDYLNQPWMRLPVNTSLIPRVNLTRQAPDGWEFRANYTFRF